MGTWASLHIRERMGRLTRKQRYQLSICFCVGLLGCITSIVVLNIERENTSRYRAENYDRLEVNTQLFLQVVDDTNSFCENLYTSIDALPTLEAYTSTELLAQMTEPGFHVVENMSPFQRGTDPHRMFNRLLSFAMVNQNYSEIVLCLPHSDVYIALAENGRYAAVCHGVEELRMIINLQGDTANLKNGTLLAAKPTHYASSPVYVVRAVDDSFLLCGISDEVFQESLLRDSSGRSYDTEQMVCVLPDGQTLMKGGGALPVEEDRLLGEALVENVEQYTLMRFELEAPRCMLIAVLRETGVTSAVTSAWFRLMIALNVLWVLSMVFIYTYFILHVLRPLRQISEEVPVSDAQAEDQSNTDELEKIAYAIHHYYQQLSTSQKTIDEQIRQLRRACLEQLALDQYPSLTAEQLEELGIPGLLSRYLLITLYPDDGRWGHVDCSDQEYRYRCHITLAAVSEALSPQLEGLDAQCLMLQSCLLIVVCVPGDEAEDFVRQRLESWVSLISAQLCERLQYGVSKVCSGQDSFSHAYHEAMLHAALVEEKESGRSEHISLNALLKQNMHMADLVYMERYDEAYACFKEMVETLFQQKSRHLRTQQLTSILQLTLTMITETNESNIFLLEQMNLDTAELLRPEGKSEVLSLWQHVFCQLETHRDNRIHGQYSGQFASVYQYMHAHFRDSSLSLSILAEEFGMSVSTLSREFQKNLGQGFLESLHRLRIEAAKYEIEHTNVPLSDIAVAVGYTNTLTMTRAFKKYMGSTPSVFRKTDTAL